MRKGDGNNIGGYKPVKHKLISTVTLELSRHQIKP